jgi:hypothetical protein
VCQCCSNDSSASGSFWITSADSDPALELRVGRETYNTGVRYGVYQRAEEQILKFFEETLYLTGTYVGVVQSIYNRWISWSYSVFLA